MKNKLLSIAIVFLLIVMASSCSSASDQSEQSLSSGSYSSTIVQDSQSDEAGDESVASSANDVAEGSDAVPQIDLPAGDAMPQSEEGNANDYKLIKLDSGVSYLGDFSEENGLINGDGIVFYPDGTMFRGTVLDGLRSGYGTYVWPDGEYYTGGWIDGKASGKGVMTYSNGWVVEGIFGYNRCIFGECRIKTPDASYCVKITGSALASTVQVEYSNGAKYSGEYDGTGLTGFGEMDYSNGASYSGYFLNGLKHGKGTYYTSSGFRYYGNWINDRYQY